jgi:predicted metal-dependent hydrolase
VGWLLHEGRVTFANDLLCQPEEFWREVIVHELLHIKVPNHGGNVKLNWPHRAHEYWPHP